MTPRRRLRIFAVAVLLVVGAGALVWRAVVERWIAHELHAFAEAHLNPVFEFDDLRYRFPRTVVLSDVNFTSADPGADGGKTQILTVATLTLSLAEIPAPNKPLRANLLALSSPTLRLIRTKTAGAPGKWLGYSDLVKTTSEPEPINVEPPAKASERFQARTATISDGRIEYDPRDANRQAVMLIDGINAELRLQPDDSGAYDIDFSLGHPPVSSIALRGKILVDDKKLNVSAFSASLHLAKDQDRHLTPALQKFRSDRGITGTLQVKATGTFDLNDPASNGVKADAELTDGTFAWTNYGLALDKVVCRLSVAAKTATFEEFTIDALDGHAEIGGTFEFDESLTSALTYEATDLQVGQLLRGDYDAKGVPLYSGLLNMSGTLGGPLTKIGQSAQGEGRLSIRNARLGRMPVLAKIDDAIDAAASALMKRESAAHDALSLNYTFEGDRAQIEKLRMNSRWYGLRGHGDLFFDSRLDLAVTGGPISRLENEMGAVGDVLGEITETLVRMRVTGNTGKPKLAIEILRHGLP